MTLLRKPDVRLAVLLGVALIATMAVPLPGEEPRPRNITFDDIKFEMAKGATFRRNMLTPEIEKLNGKPVRIRGYILPSFQQSGIKQFVLVRDNMQCCFGPGAALYDCVLVDMTEGKSASFTVRPVAVSGTFSIDELKGPDGKHLAIYKLAGQEVR